MNNDNDTNSYTHIVDKIVALTMLLNHNISKICSKIIIIMCTGYIYANNLPKYIKNLHL